MRVFISGRVTGLPWADAQANFNRGVRLCDANNLTCVNPMLLVPAGTSHKEAMRICINELLECDAILLLADNKFSEGSQIEEALARYCGLLILTEDDLISDDVAL